MKNIALIFVSLFSVSLLAQERETPTKIIESKNCTVKVVENCSAATETSSAAPANSVAPLIIFNCTSGEGFKCLDRCSKFHKKFTNIKTEFKSVKMTINLHSGIVGDGPNTPIECQSRAQDCVDIVAK
jgi:hypothetical protein